MKEIMIKMIILFGKNQKTKKMNNEYVIVNKTALLKMREELIHVSDYQRGQMDLIDAIVSSQSTPLIPEIKKAYNYGVLYSNSIKKTSCLSLLHVCVC